MRSSHNFSRSSATAARAELLKIVLGSKTHTSGPVHSQQLALLLYFLHLKDTISINISLYIMAGIVWAC